MKKQKHVLIFVAIVILVSVITGFIYGINSDYVLDNYLSSLSNHNNLFLNDLLLISIFLFSTISLIGIIFNTFIMGIEGVSMGFILGLFFKRNKFKGLAYGLCLIGVNRLLMVIILMYLYIVGVIYVKKSMRNLVGLSNDYTRHMLMPLLKKYGLIILFVIIYDILVYFFGNILLNYLTFML